MTQFPLTEQIRERVRDLLCEMGADDGPFEETVLIRDGHYCGRRFEMNGNSAVWFIEENQIKCFAANGALHSVADAIPDDFESHQSRAA